MHSLAFGEEVPVISLGKVCTKWKGFLNIPFWTDATISFTGITPITLPKEAISFKFGLNWRGENETRASQKCTIITRVEKETYPGSGKWELLFEEANDMISRGGVVNEEAIVTKTISQQKPEVRYKITVRAVMPFGQKIKPNSTYITVRLTSKAYYTYTSIPIIPIAILHDPNGDESYTALQPQTCITHLLSINIAGLEVKIEDQKKLLLEVQNAKIEINKVEKNTNTVEIKYIPKEEITSAISKDPCLIGPGLGDTYILIKDLPVKFKFSKVFTPAGKEIKSLTFCIVSPQEAGLSPKEGFDILLVPAASLRSYDKACPIFATWRKLDIDDEIRQQLIEMNIGWDNSVSNIEKTDVVDLGEGYLNFKDQTIKEYKQVNLNKVSFYSEIIMEPYFAAMAGIPISRDRILAAITLNESPINKTIPMEMLKVTLEDDDRQNIPGDFFTYHFYLDKRFGTLLLITKDDKSKPATLDSIYVRSFSSQPKEYWTEDLNIIPVEVSIYGLVTSTTGEGIDNVNLEVRSEDKVVKKTITKPGGTYTITGLMQGVKYTLLLNADGYKSKTVEIKPFFEKELAREINIVLERMPPKIPEVPPVEEVIVKKPPALPPEVEPKELVEAPPKEEKPLPPKEKIPNLLTNGNFSLGLKGWKLIKIGAGKEMYAKVIRNDFTYPYAVEIKRRGSMRVKGEMGIRQILNKDVSIYAQLVLKADVKVIYSSLESDGRRGGAYPIQLQIDYIDEKGRHNSWRHGFLYAKRINYPNIGERIPQDRWFTYISDNLLELTPKPKIIKEIRLSGSGWGFHSRIANVQLVGSKQPPIVKEEKPIPPTPKEPKRKVEIPSLLTNGDFSSGLKAWKLIKIGAGKEMYAKVIKNDFTYPFALEIKRRGSMRVKGEMGVIQVLNKDVSKYTQLILKADIKVIYSSLESDGRRGGAYPIGIRIDYIDTADKPHLWRHGFLYAKKINYPQIGEQIPQDKWYSYISPNLMELEPKPKIIKEIRLSGSGWGFHSRIANVELIGK
jgi:hypothetical protein